MEKLKKIKKEMEMFYKDLIKILFVESMDKDVAINMEKKINNLIMSVNDQIDEIEIRQAKTDINSMKGLNDPKVNLPLEKKQVPVRASSTDFRQN